VSLTEHQRLQAVIHAEFLARNHAHVGYVFGGGLDWLDQSMVGMEKRFLAGEIWYPDCRASINWIAKWSGWRGFGKYGFEASSGEMWQVLPHNGDPDDVGTLVTYGEDGDEHVCMIVRPGWVFSLGEAFDAHIIPLDWETAAHPGQPVTYLAVGE
jgi:hypothetical protein